MVASLMAITGYIACQRAGRHPRTIEWQVTDASDGALIKVVVSANLHRRHLDTSQRAVVGARLATLTHGGDRRSDQAAIWPVETHAQAAALLNVGERSVRRAREVLDSGDQELIRAVEQGAVAVSAAAQTVRAPPRRADRPPVALPRALDVFEEARQSLATEMLGITVAALREIAANPVSPPIIKEIASAAIAEIEEDGFDPASVPLPGPVPASPRSRSRRRTTNAFPEAA